MIQELAIVGVGLLGGSVAKAARAGGLARRIVGVGRDVARLQPAVDDGSLDAATIELETGVREADFILLAAPVLAIEGLLERMWRAAPDGTVITDVGSTKRNIVRAAERLAARRPLAFVGSHPLAGSEQSGYGVARADLFRGATVVVTPTEGTELGALKRVTEFWEALGARVSSLDPETHDRTVAAISHLPHLIACALVDGAGRVEPAALELAARGFRDTTRIAAGDPALWTAILLQNRAAILDALTSFEGALGQFREALERGDRAAIDALLGQGKRNRDALGS